MVTMDEVQLGDREYDGRAARFIEGVREYLDVQVAEYDEWARRDIQGGETLAKAYRDALRVVDQMLDQYLRLDEY